MPYWITSTLAATPAFLWIILGVGLPFALVALPRKDWRDVPIVACLAIAFGPALLTVWMFILGTIGGATGQPLLRFDLIFGGTLILAIIGIVLAWRKRHFVAEPTSSHPLALDEKLLLVLIGASLIVMWFSTAYWPFTAYDTLWVYGYEARLYTLHGYIPTNIAYYPQFIPLQYTYGQLALGGIDDHAARAVIPFLHIGSILATHTLGNRLFNRRVGLIAAALWALYPHVGEWARFGDLEIPLTFLFTTSAAFFLMAWFGAASSLRRRYALIAGLVFGVALWTKPTAGAFVWGVALLLIVELFRVRLDWQAWRPRFEVALITGLASAPLGGVWYLRNIAYGHNPIDLPPAYWLTQAQRSGVEFGWPLLALLVLLAYLYFGGHSTRPNLTRVLIGLGLVLMALLPSIIVPHRIVIVGWTVLAIGLGVLTHTLLKYIRAVHEPPLRSLAKIGAALLLALPYFVTWFYSYSYHYRLSFAIVPLLLLPTALILAHWFTPERIAAWRPARRLVYLAVIVLVSIPGVIAALYDVNADWDWLWSDELPNDFNRYDSGNKALMNVVGGLDTYLRENDIPPVVVAPGEQRLPFFYPLMDIRDDAPLHLEELEGVTHYIYSFQSRGAYEPIPITENEVVGSLGRNSDVMRRAWGESDGNFFYHVFTPYPERRWIEPQPNAPAEGEVVFGGFARFLGYDLGGLEFWPGRPVGVKLMWQVIEPTDIDYTMFIHLRRDGEVLKTWDAQPAEGEHGYYSTLLWMPGEYITDEHILRLAENEVEPGEGYSLVFGMYDLQTQQRVPITMNGEPAGDGVVLHNQVTVLLQEPS